MLNAARQDAEGPLTTPNKCVKSVSDTWHEHCSG